MHRIATLPGRSGSIHTLVKSRCMGRRALTGIGIMDDGHRDRHRRESVCEAESKAGGLAERAQAAREASPFLTAKQTAFYLCISTTTLKRMRRAGTGPRCSQPGRTWRYHIDDIEAWRRVHGTGGGND